MSSPKMNPPQPTARGDLPAGKALQDADTAANYLSIGKTLLFRFVKEGKIPSVKVGHRRLFKTQDLDAFVANLEG